MNGFVLSSTKYSYRGCCLRSGLPISGPGQRGKEIKGMLVNEPPNMAYIRMSFQNAL